ncbi:iron chaperone [Saccharopolyspora flava]|uniref:Uncharacterized conserved protein YdhG, YjbR/CyaY-like superfamily, DUF1801 family n=1 Tax=Saccharopolyspora flava TaxID=95161 RepID=A0A1I6NVP4_9PSEU|nr:DUF1801 domain-containing protein [Saccharopolyspora flava]SFS32027.1 Uncharacterized conserved protein YdhG, YjbR/CyaY-like superfamily, DUF1801 family [Saccharopolyspora flava]
MAGATTIDEYLDGFTGEKRELLAELRRIARETVPEASETIKWGNPAWVHPSGTILFAFSGHAEHTNVAFTPSTKEAFAAELAEFDTGKGTVKLPYGRPVPEDLLRRMITYRLREHEDHGVLWK